MFLQEADTCYSGVQTLVCEGVVRYQCLLHTMGAAVVDSGSGVETDSRSAAQEITRILRIPNVHYRVHNSPSGDSSPHTTPYFGEVRFNIILPATA